jgi:hypothetical protein
MPPQLPIQCHGGTEQKKKNYYLCQKKKDVISDLIKVKLSYIPTTNKVVEMFFCQNIHAIYYCRHKISC